MSESESQRCPDCGRPIPEGAPQGMCPKCLLSEAAIDIEPAAGPLGPSPSLEEVAQAFPALDLIEVIGEGGMGVVYKARQRRLDRLVALKLLRCPPDKEAHFAERFLREARALAKLNHPHIVTIYDFGETQGLFYLIMEYVDGVNLRQAMGGGHLTPEEALRIVPVVCEALQFAHEKGVLHRDIKPANILLTREGVVKMADFGLAKFIDDTHPSHLLTQTEAALGTPAYMAPEQTTDPGRVDHRADIYSLGVVFYEMLTGDLPLGRFPAPSEKIPVDQRVDDVVMRTLAREPDARYQSAQEIKTDVEHLSAAPTLSVAPPTASASVPTPSPPVTEHDSRTTPPPSKVETPSNVAPHPSPSRRLLWRGVIGALLVLLSLPGAWLWARLLLVIAESSSRGYGPSGISINPLILILLGLALSLTGTLLGWSASHRFRNAPERYWGKGLAAFAALTWPLLGLAGLFLIAGYYGRQHVDVIALSILGFVLLSVYSVLRYRRWLLQLAPPKHWYGIYAAVILGVPCYQIARDFIARDSQGRSDTVAIASRGEDHPLIRAVTSGDSGHVALLLEEGADPNAVWNNGYAPLLFAASNGDTQIVRTLLEYGARIDATNPDLGQNGLHLAAQHGHDQSVRFLIDHGIEASSRDTAGQTALMLASYHGHDTTVQALISKAGLPLIDLVDQHGRTALDHALARGQSSIARSLLGHGARETCGWHLQKAFTSKLQGWDKVIGHLESALAALKAHEVKQCQFGFDGWWYTIPDPRLTANAMLVEASARGDRNDLARQAVSAAEEAWPDESKTVMVFERADSPLHPWAVQGHHLKREDLDHPIRSQENEALIHWGQPTTPMAQRFTSSTFFR